MTATVPRAFQFKLDQIGPWVIGLIAVTLIAGGVLVVLRSMSVEEQVRWLIALLAVTLVLGVLAIMLALRTLKANRALLTGMQQLAREDALTGAINRRGLDDVVPVEFARARRSGQPLTFVMIDLDHFKRYNDRRGHPAGDAVLRGAAQAWLKQLRPTDILARYGERNSRWCCPAPTPSRRSSWWTACAHRCPIGKRFPPALPPGTATKQRPRFCTEPTLRCCRRKRRAAIE